MMQKNLIQVKYRGFLPGYIAMLLSWSVNKSVGWAILHTMFGPPYILYWLIKYTALCEWINTWVVQ